MHNSTPRTAIITAAAPSKQALVMGVVAPFAAIALLASPLALDTLKHLVGL
jgi:hypothetical protein